MFTFNKSKNPICRIIGGKLNGRIVYMSPKTEGNTPQNIDFSNKSRDSVLHCLYCKTKFTRPDTRKRHEDYTCRFKQINEMMGKYLNVYEQDKGCKDLSVDDGTLQPLPNPNIREVLYIAGPAGSGKSYYMSKWLKESELILNKEIILFSRLQDDAAFDELGEITRVNISELGDDNIPIDDLKDSICIFDDIETSENPKITRYLEKLRDDCIKNGRDHSYNGEDIYVISTNHQVTDYKATRDLLNECTSLTVFPKSSGTYGIKYALQKYFGLGKNQIEKILNINSRWITLYKTYPAYCITEHQLFFLSDLQ